MGLLRKTAPRDRTPIEADDDAPVPEQYREQRGLRASARRIPLNNKKALRKIASLRQEWQDESWEYFDDVPEIKFTTWLGGNVMSKLRLYVAVRPLDNPEGDPIPVLDPESGISTVDGLRATAELERIKSPLGGRPEIIRAFSMNLEIAGELYLHCKGPRVVMQEQPGTDEKLTLLYDEEWNVRSVDEVEVKGEEVFIHEKPGDKGDKVDDNADTLVRIWQRHPRWSYLPDCNMRGVLSECEAVVLLSNQVKAIAKSAASSGFMTLPDELGYTIPKPNEQGDGEDEPEDPMADMVHDQLVEPIEDPSSARAVAPGLIRGPGEFLKPDYLRHFTLERKADENLDQRIEARVERIARGLNYPVETVKGHAETTFANAAQIDEDKFRDHYEPKCVMLVDAITVGVLQTNLVEAGMSPDVAERLIVWYDASAIVRSVDPEESADVGYDNGVISDVAWRRVKGWTEDDAPSPEERLIRSVLRLRAMDPGLSTALLELLGVPLNVPAVVPAGTTIGDGSEPDFETEPEIPAPPMSLELALLEVLVAHKQKRTVKASAAAALEPALVAGGLQAAIRRHNNAGRQLSDLDRNLRTKLLVSADRALTRALERAGNRLKSQADANMKAIVRSTHPMYAAQQLGPKLVASAGFTDDDLIGLDAWDALEKQFLEWGAGAQQQAIKLANKIVGLSAPERAALQVRQAGDLKEAWSWTKDQLHELAVRKLYSPDPTAAGIGEFDPTSKVPTGLIRQALSRAGGASGLTITGTDPYVALDNGQPMGGIGTGELIGETLAAGGAEIDAYEWVYGPAYRQSPFEEHEALDGETFVNFDDDVLTAGDWIGDYYFPGDHDGCNCDFVPVIIAPGDLSDGEN